MKLTLIFCLFLCVAGSHSAMKNVLDLYPEFKQLKDSFNEKIKNITEKLNSYAEKTNSNSLRLKAYVYAQVEMIGYQYIKEGQKIIFNGLIADSRGAYSTQTGVFTAPFQGTYLFSVNVCEFMGDISIQFNIVKDGARLTTGFMGDKNWGSCGSATAVTYMTEGSKVWVTYGKNNYEKEIRIAARHTFTAALLV